MIEYTEGKASCYFSDMDNQGLSKEAASRLKMLTHLYVSPEDRKQGHATSLLKKLGEEADQANLAILVQPKAYDDGEVGGKELELFYAKNGYTKLQDSPLIMVRYPKEIQQKKSQKLIQTLSH